MDLLSLPDSATPMPNRKIQHFGRHSLTSFVTKVLFSASSSTFTHLSGTTTASGQVCRAIRDYVTSVESMRGHNKLGLCIDSISLSHDGPLDSIQGRIQGLPATFWVGAILGLPK